MQSIIDHFNYIPLTTKGFPAWNAIFLHIFPTSYSQDRKLVNSRLKNVVKFVLAPSAAMHAIGWYLPGFPLSFIIRNKVLPWFMSNVNISKSDTLFNWLVGYYAEKTTMFRFRSAQNLELSTSSAGCTSRIIPPSHDHARDSESYAPQVRPIVGTPYFLYHWWGFEEIIFSSLGSHRLSLNLIVFSWIPGYFEKKLNERISQGRKYYDSKAQSVFQSIYAAYFSSRALGFQLSQRKQRRDWDSVILETGLKERIFHDVKEFLGSREWYKLRDVPFRRGYLLYGPPGSGKTTLVQAIAGLFGLPIYTISLSSPAMSDESLITLMNMLPCRCILLLEDIDVAFAGPRDLSYEHRPEESKLPEGDEMKTRKASMSITLSGLLNALDGVNAPEGRILFATTNVYTALDKALSRPGRLDEHINLRLTTKYQSEELFKRFYPGSILEDGKRFAEMVPEDKYSIAELQNFFLQFKNDGDKALERFADWAEEFETDKQIQKGEDMLAKKVAYKVGNNNYDSDYDFDFDSD